MSRAPASLLAVLVMVPSLLAEASRLEAAEAPEVWLLSTRGLAQHAAASEPYPALRYRRLSADGAWADADPAEFFAAADPAVPTCIYVHGNRETSQSAIHKGMLTYRLLAACRADRPLRFVIWSWPAEEVCRRNRDDLRLKAARSDRQAELLASTLRRVHPATPVTLVGYSFGARAITGALHLLGGGQVAGKTVEAGTAVAGRTWRAVLVAAAMPNDWLLPGHRHGLALPLVETVLISVNPCDPVLRWYPRLYGRGGPEALGYTGPACPGRFDDDRGKLDLLAVASAVGKNHSWPAYLSSGGLRERMAQYVFSSQAGETAAAAAPLVHETAEAAGQ